MQDVASPDEVKVQEQKLSPSASRLGLLVTLISHSAAEERFFARAKKSDSAAAQRMSKLLLTCPLPGTPSRQSREVQQRRPPAEAKAEAFARFVARIRSKAASGGDEASAEASPRVRSDYPGYGAWDRLRGFRPMPEPLFLWERIGEREGRFARPNASSPDEVKLQGAKAFAIRFAAWASHFFFACAKKK